MNTTELPAPGDFVQVNSSYYRGKEGCIKALDSNSNSEYTISLTSSQTTMPTVILESDISVTILFHAYHTQTDPTFLYEPLMSS